MNPNPASRKEWTKETRRDIFHLMESYAWSRKYPVGGDFATVRDEVWTRGQESFPLRVQFGKNTDLFGLKSGTLSEFEKQVERHRHLCQSFLTDDNMIWVDQCTLCGLSSREAIPDATIHGVTYYRCPRCDIRYLRKRLSNEALDKFYVTDTVLSSTYTDKERVQKRIDEIVGPKVEWAVAEFQRIIGRKPRKIVDMGAGAGHFVFAAQRQGQRVSGIEFNAPSIAFAKETLDIDLIRQDFLEYAKDEKECDMITFWNVLEHLPDFMAFLRAAHGIFSNNRDGMIIVEVPRWHSLDTIIQRMFPDWVTRHLFPLSHIRIFSDAALANAFVQSGFAPTGAWFFGMDMYEFAVQLARKLEHENIISETGNMLLNIQPAIDQGLLSDAMVFSGRIRS